MTRVKMEKRKPTKFAYVEHVGPYDKIPFKEYIEKLYGWAKVNHIRPGFYPMGLFLDPPTSTTCRSEIGIQIYNQAKPEDGIMIKELPKASVATISHKGTSEEYPKTYRELNDWISTHGYKWAGPSIEIYTRKPKVVGGATILYAKIEAPVEKVAKTTKLERTVD